MTKIKCVLSTIALIMLLTNCSNIPSSEDIEKITQIREKLSQIASEDISVYGFEDTKYERIQVLNNKINTNNYCTLRISHTSSYEENFKKPYSARIFEIPVNDIDINSIKSRKATSFTENNSVSIRTKGKSESIRENILKWYKKEYNDKVKMNSHYRVRIKDKKKVAEFTQLLKEYTELCQGNKNLPSETQKQKTTEIYNTEQKTQKNTANTLTGTILEAFNAGGYTYMQIDNGTGKIWAAISKAEVKVGQTVNIKNGPVMKDFHSSSLNRTFSEIVFSSGLQEAKAE